jgi:oligoribonuclease (3'-5' exoribonuclease)
MAKQVPNKVIQTDAQGNIVADTLNIVLNDSSVTLSKLSTIDPWYVVGSNNAGIVQEIKIFNSYIAN